MGMLAKPSAYFEKRIYQEGASALENYGFGTSLNLSKSFNHGSVIQKKHIKIQWTSCTEKSTNIIYTCMLSLDDAKTF